MQLETQEHRPERIGPYRLNGLLGVGGMGEVHRAYDERLDRWVALKKISPAGSHHQHLRQRFQREARAAARLNHPTIVQIYDIFEQRGVDWIVMELVEGQTLAQRVREGPMALRRLLEIARELASGLAAAHAEGIVHRDLKAENIMLTREKRIKILDFGLAKQLWQADSEISLSIEGTLLGTARSMAPEQALGKLADHRTDLFAFGILLYEMATGKSPFLGPTAVETAIRVCSHRQTPVRQHNGQIPEELSRLIDRLLEKEPDRRPASIYLVSVELEDLLATFSEAGAGTGGSEPMLGTATGSVIEPSLSGSLSLYDAPSSSRLSYVEPAIGTRRGIAPQAGVDEAMVQIQRERRPVTVMCCDLVACGDDDQGLDPELLFEVTQGLQEMAEGIVRHFGGYLEQTPDHRLLVYFGYPKAMEDAALRAVSAAQSLIAQVEEHLHRDRPLGEDTRLGVRIGIHSGPAVVQTGRPGARVILGQTLDLASTLRSRALGNTMLISRSTADLVAPHCELDALPALRTRHLDRPLRAYRCRRRSPEHSVPWATTKTPPLMGREQELTLLQERWRLARDGAGQVVALVAEAGYGKSRLLQAFTQSLDEKNTATLYARGTFEHREQGFSTVVALLHQLLDIRPEDDEEQQLDKLEALLGELQAPLEAMVPLLGELLSLSTQRRYPATNPAVEPPGKTLETLLALFLETSRRRPLLIIVEDLEWVDASTLKLLSCLLKRSEAVPILTLLTYRPGFAPTWSGGRSHTRLTLGALRWPDASELIHRLFPKGVEPPVRRQLLERANGVPRYVVELARHVRRDSAGHMVLPSSMPTTLQDGLMSQLDELEGAKQLAQLAAVLGRSMPGPLLQELQVWDAVTFEEHLESLLVAGVLSRRGFPGAEELTFRHTLAWEMAYGSLLTKERQRLHRRVVGLLDQHTQSGRQVDAARLAYHCHQAGDLTAAVGHYESAARRDAESGNQPLAIESLQKGLRLLRRLPEGDDRDRRELSLLVALGPLVSGARGFEDPILEEIYTRAGDLCLVQEDEAQNFRILRSISAFFIARARPKRSLLLVQKLMQIADHAEDPELLLEACYATGLTHFTLGQLAAARLHLDKGIALDRARSAEPPAGDSSEDPGVACRGLAALVAWHLGSIDEAVELSRGAIEKARQLSHPGTLAAALSFGAWLHQLRRDRRQVEVLARETVEISQRGGFLLWSTYGQLLLGWAQLKSDDSGEGPPRPEAENAAEAAVTETHNELFGLSLEVYRDAGVLFAQTYLLSLLAEASTERGEIDRALRHLLEALTAVEASSECFWQAELLRLCGTMVLHSVDTGADHERLREAEGYFERALDVARRQGCRSLELRAAASLGRLWAERGMEKQAVSMVEPLYRGFDQGLDSADLVETRQWLDRLAAASPA